MRNHRKLRLMAFIPFLLSMQEQTLAHQRVKIGVYQLATRDCLLQLRAKKGGRVVVDSPNGNFSLFSEESDASGWSLTFDFQCMMENPKNHCPTAWMNELRDEDPGTLKRMHIRKYDSQHPHYYSMAYSASRNTEGPPRSRTLYFCLGNETRTVVGHVPIGDEKKQFSTQALKIINTLQIQPTVNAQTRP